MLLWACDPAHPTPQQIVARKRAVSVSIACWAVSPSSARCAVTSRNAVSRTAGVGRDPAHPAVAITNVILGRQIEIGLSARDPLLLALTPPTGSKVNVTLLSTVKVRGVVIR